MAKLSHPDAVRRARRAGLSVQEAVALARLHEDESDLDALIAASTDDAAERTWRRTGESILTPPPDAKTQAETDAEAASIKADAKAAADAASEGRWAL